MWNLNLQKLEALLPCKFGGTAIECGTCRGNGARGLAQKFSRVITIELSEMLYKKAQARLAEDCPHVECLHGNSATELARILPTLPPNEPVFIFLDAHWSGDESVNWEKSEWKGYGIDTAHLAQGDRLPTGPEQCPLLEELQAIVQHCRGPAHILIDDMKNVPPHGQGLKNSTFPGEDWSHLSRQTLFSVVEPRLEKLHELSDPSQWFLELRASSLPHIE